MNRLKKTIAFTLFVFVSATMLIVASFKLWTPLSSKDYVILTIYLFLMVFVNSYTLKIGEIYITFLLAISIAVFLEYGIIVEAWLTQAALIISMLVSVQKRTIPRMVLTQMMFIWISLTSGFAFLLAGGTNGFTVRTVSSQLVPIVLYIATYFIVNHLIIYIIRRIIENRHIAVFSEDIVWDAATLLLALPLGVIMYLVKITYGLYGMLFVALPIVIVTHLFKIYSELHHAHKQLKVLNRVSSSFTSELNFDKTIAALQNAIRELLTFDYSYIFLINGEKLKLISLQDFQGNRIDSERLRNFVLALGEGLSGRVALYKKGEIVASDADIFQFDVENDYIKDNKSILSVPMVWHNKIIGVITLGSTVEYHFSKKDFTIAKILASQAAVAIQNAAIYQKTEEKSLIDELTGLYNYRAFDDLLNEMVNEAGRKEECVSLLMIDLDHFKRLNDRYGHSAGNQVLKEISALLKELTRREDVVARYGGEEFTIILPNADYYKTLAIAERIRHGIETHPIRIKESIKDEDELIVHVTASIGIASFPEMASSTNELIRHADRAMYIGSKQAGRNRVSVYQNK